MPGDLVERLRFEANQDWRGHPPSHQALCLEAADEIEALLDDLEDMVNQACWNAGTLDSVALSAYADAMRSLAARGRLVIDSEYGRRVIGHWPTKHDQGGETSEGLPDAGADG